MANITQPFQTGSTLGRVWCTDPAIVSPNVLTPSSASLCGSSCDEVFGRHGPQFVPRETDFDLSRLRGNATDTVCDTLGWSRHFGDSTSHRVGSSLPPVVITSGGCPEEGRWIPYSSRHKPCEFICGRTEISLRADRYDSALPAPGLLHDQIGPERWFSPLPIGHECSDTNVFSLAQHLVRLELPSLWDVCVPFRVCEESASCDSLCQVSGFTTGGLLGRHSFSGGFNGPVSPPLLCIDTNSHVSGLGNQHQEINTGTVKHHGVFRFSSGLQRTTTLRVADTHFDQNQVDSGPHPLDFTQENTISQGLGVHDRHFTVGRQGSSDRSAQSALFIPCSEFQDVVGLKRDSIGTWCGGTDVVERTSETFGGCASSTRPGHLASTDGRGRDGLGRDFGKNTTDCDEGGSQSIISPQAGSGQDDIQWCAKQESLGQCTSISDSGSSRFLQRTGQHVGTELSGNISSAHGIEVLCADAAQHDGYTALRQHHNIGCSTETGQSHHSSRRISPPDLQTPGRLQNSVPHVLPRCGPFECDPGSSLASARQLGLGLEFGHDAIPSDSFSPAMPNRSLRFDDEYTPASFQLSSFLSQHGSDRLLFTGLVKPDKLVESPILVDTSGRYKNSRGSSSRDFDNTSLDSKRVVSSTRIDGSGLVRFTTFLDIISRWFVLAAGFSDTRPPTFHYKSVEALVRAAVPSRLGSHAAHYFFATLKPDTWKQYVSSTTQFINFVARNVRHDSDLVCWPPTTAMFLDFLAIRAQSLTRPQSQLSQYKNGISLLCKACGFADITTGDDVAKVISGITRAETKVPVRHTPTFVSYMPLFVAYLKSFPIRSVLDLRLKTLVLIQLCAFARTADLAADVCFRESVIFEDLRLQQGALLTFVRMVSFGGKTDKSRLGQEIQLFPCSDVSLCPVFHLRAYIFITSTFASTFTDSLVDSARRRTPIFFSHDDIAFPISFSFRSLYSTNLPWASVQHPLAAVFSPLSLEDVFSDVEVSPLTSHEHSRLLTAFIRSAGITDPLITARSFRPTAASIAHAGGISMDEILRLGRWSTNSLEMVLRTYTRLGPGAHISDLLLQHSAFIPSNTNDLAFNNINTNPNNSTQYSEHTHVNNNNDVNDSDSDQHSLDSYDDFLASRPAGYWHPFE